MVGEKRENENEDEDEKMMEQNRKSPPPSF